MICWRCHEKVGGPVCAGCDAIQPPPADPDHFAVLGLPRRWHLDAGEIDRAWRARSRLVHPDRFAGRSAVERRMSLQWTAAINGARRALRDPIRRGWYIVTGEARPREDGRIALDPDFLEQIFELQVEAQADPDAVTERARAMYDQVMADLDARFTEWEAGGPLDGPAIEELLARSRYLDNLVNHAGTQP
ncbi:MAG: hypothetical protein D6798_04810 [Deltaproteobacteria bacterium]|nr:MAG: hypothetical protein D6798_04810 [Deltaproteobacteria bacterium]